MSSKKNYKKINWRMNEKTHRMERVDADVPASAQPRRYVPAANSLWVDAVVVVEALTSANERQALFRGRAADGTLYEWLAMKHYIRIGEKASVGGMRDVAQPEAGAVRIVASRLERMTADAN